jgi:hypothetical protein
LDIVLPAGVSLDVSGNIIDNREVSLDELINIENFIFTSVSGTNFKIKSIKAKSFNDIRITIPGRGMSTGTQNKGSYIFKIHTKVPNFDKLTDSEKLDLISLINKTK